MAKVKVLVLYPTGFLALGIEPKGSDVVEVDEAHAVTLVGAGWAEYIKQPKTVVTETAEVKLSKGKAK
jgi:ABC-type Zn uptake system ZnuABC Zn-binding protein ZnuA